MASGMKFRTKHYATIGLMVVGGIFVWEKFGKNKIKL